MTGAKATQLNVMENEFVLPYISRVMWNAKEPNGNTRPLFIPVTHVRYTHTKTEKCFSDEECIKIVRKLQKKHMKKGLPDIRYNFLVGSGGVVYEGRGWDADADRPEAFKTLRTRCLDIALIGDYREKNPSWQHMRSCFDLLRYGIRHDYIQKAYKIIPFRNWTLTLNTL